MNEQDVRRIIREELIGLTGGGQFTFERPIQILDGRNIQLGQTTGTQIGQATTQKLAFWGKTPIIQPSHANQAAISMASVTGGNTVSEANVQGNFTDIQNLLNQLRTDLIAAGIIKGSA